MALEQPLVLAPVPRERVEPLRALRERLLAAERVALTTHVNADGDGTGSQAAIAAWLLPRGARVTIVNPTPFPDAYRFVLPDGVGVLDWGSPEARRELEAADLLLVLDTSEPRRIEPIGEQLPRERIVTLDHHPRGRETVADGGFMDPSAAATGELVYDLLRLGDQPPPDAALLGIYVAMVTDTGSFRFSNTTPRTHLVAAELLARGVDPEAVYRQLYATVPMRRVELLREALATLRHEPDTGISWLTVDDTLIGRLGATAEDLDGLVEHARSLQGTDVALLFRGMPDGATKVSLRSNGDADVNRIARRFGGGGHVKAAGATLPLPLADAVPAVIEAVVERMKDEG